MGLQPGAGMRHRAVATSPTTCQGFPHPTPYSLLPSLYIFAGITTSIVTPTSCTDIYVGEVISITIFPTALFLAGDYTLPLLPPLLLLLLLQACFSLQMHAGRAGSTPPFC